MQNNTLILKLAGACMVWAALSASASFAQGRYQISADGREVEDKRTSLIWGRCVEGMEWKGRNCQGTVMLVSYPMAAMQATGAASRSGGGWRLPTLKELVSIARPAEADIGAGIAAIDAETFPGTPPLRFWTSSVAGPHYYMYVGFKDGEAGENSRSMLGALRLVRDKK